MELDQLEGRVRRFLQAQLDVDVASLGRGDPLVTSALVDSVGLVRLAAFLEREADIAIPDHEVIADNFDSLDHIERYVRRKLTPR